MLLRTLGNKTDPVDLTENENHFARIFKGFHR